MNDLKLNMGKIGEEVTRKIKSAVKAKLIELGVEIDNELPDYIMVLIANKKSQSQMENDLQLFLGSGTSSFVLWLLNVLQKLEKVTVPNDRLDFRNTCESKSLTITHEDVNINRSSNEEVTTKTESPVVKIEEHYIGEPNYIEIIKSEVELDSDCLDITPNDEGDVFLEDDEEFDSTEELCSRVITDQGGEQSDFNHSQQRNDGDDSEILESRQITSERHIDDYNITQDSVNSLSKETANKKRNLFSLDNLNNEEKLNYFNRGSRVRRTSENNDGNGHAEKELYTLRSRVECGGGDTRNKVTDAREILKRKSSNRYTNEDDRHSRKRKLYGRTRSNRDQMASKVCTSGKQMMRPAVQPNNKLLLLAVADAEKSLAQAKKKKTGQRIHCSLESDCRETDKSDIVASVTASLHSSPGQSRHSAPKANLFVTVRNALPASGNIAETRRVSSLKYNDMLESPMEVDSPNEISYDEEPMEYAKNTWKILHDREMEILGKRYIVHLDDSSPEKFDDLKDVRYDFNRLAPAQIATVSPTVVHLPNSRQVVKNLFINDEEGQKNIQQDSSLNKSLEKCKFWPNCRDSNRCSYYHPITPCRLFPPCPFGSKCLFIHPDCKYDSKCSKTDCNYVHRSPVIKASEVSFDKSVGTSGRKLCQFHPKCTNQECVFWHPAKTCRYGLSCARRDCIFFHPKKSIPPKELLTWKAD